MLRGVSSTDDGLDSIWGVGGRELVGWGMAMAGVEIIGRWRSSKDCMAQNSDRS